VILQRLRDAEDEQTYGEYAGREGDIVSGVIQQGNDPRMVLVNIGRLEAILPPVEQVPGETVRARRTDQVLRRVVRKGLRGPSVTLSRTIPISSRSCSRWRCRRSPTVRWTSRDRARGRHRTKIAVRALRSGINAKGACIGPMGARVRNVMSELHGEKIDIVDWSEEPTEFVANALSPARVNSVEIVDAEARLPGWWSRLPAVTGHRQGGAECSAGRAAHRLADRHSP
jgi:N utilization substance protein A